MPDPAPGSEAEGEGAPTSDRPPLLSQARVKVGLETARRPETSQSHTASPHTGPNVG
jgi:hypothetical protein